MTIYLAPEYRGKGYGRTLLHQLIIRCQSKGIRQLIAVIADTSDPASVTVHRSCGFTYAGRLTRVGYKHNRWIDTILMERTL